MAWYLEVAKPLYKALNISSIRPHRIISFRYSNKMEIFSSMLLNRIGSTWLGKWWIISFPLTDIVVILCPILQHMLVIEVSRISNAWWCHQMETFSTLLAFCAEKSPVTGEFPAQRPVTQSFDVFFHLHLNKQISKQLWGWWFEAPSGLLWRHCNGIYPQRDPHSITDYKST